MAMVLDAFASYLQGMLTEMAAEQIHLLLGVSVEIDKMGRKLKDHKKFLADADKRNITDESVQGWVTELKRAMYEATDILDLCQLKAMERGESSVDAGCFSPFLFCIRNPFYAHDHRKPHQEAQCGPYEESLLRPHDAVECVGHQRIHTRVAESRAQPHAPGRPLRRTGGSPSRAQAACRFVNVLSTPHESGEFLAMVAIPGSREVSICDVAGGTASS